MRFELVGPDAIFGSPFGEKSYVRIWCETATDEQKMRDLGLKHGDLVRLAVWSAGATRAASAMMGKKGTRG